MDIRLINKGAEELQHVIKNHNNLPAQHTPGELSKSAPYFGYINIVISGVTPFVMFSNNDDFVAQSFFWNGSDAYESLSLRIWSTLAKKSPGILDIGSYSGIYSLAAAKANSKAKVYAFEALNRVFTRLIINKNVNQCGNIKAFNQAVSDSNGNVEFNIYAGESILVSGSSILEKNTNRDIYEKIIIKSVTIDDFIQNESPPKIGLLKIDTEGAEHQVIQGAKKLIHNNKPDILCEFLGGAKTGQIEKMLSGLGYRYIQINEKTMEFIETEHLTPGNGMDNLNTLITQRSVSELSQLLLPANSTTMD